MFLFINKMKAIDGLVPLLLFLLNLLHGLSACCYYYWCLRIPEYVSSPWLVPHFIFKMSLTYSFIHYLISMPCIPNIDQALY